MSFEVSARGEEVYWDFLWGWRGWWAPFLYSLYFACTRRLAGGPTTASRLTPPCAPPQPRPTSSPAHNQQRGHSLSAWISEPRGHCIAGPCGTETIRERVTGRFPPPRAWHRQRTETHPRSSWEKGYLLVLSGSFRLATHPEAV